MELNIKFDHWGRGKRDGEFKCEKFYKNDIPIAAEYLVNHHSWNCFFLWHRKQGKGTARMPKVLFSKNKVREFVKVPVSSIDRFVLAINIVNYL